MSCFENNFRSLSAFSASTHLETQRHHLSPAFKPGKLYRGIGDIRLFPMDAEKFKNSLSLSHILCECRYLLK